MSHLTNFIGFLKIVHSLAFVFSTSEAVQSAGELEEAAEKLTKRQRKDAMSKNLILALNIVSYTFEVKALLFYIKLQTLICATSVTENK